MTASAVILPILSPIIVALLRRLTWPKPVVSLLAVVIVTIVYTLGLWLDGGLSWPLNGSYWSGLFAAFGMQQLAYFLVFRNVEPIKELERF